MTLEGEAGSTPLVTIAMTVYNGERYLAQALESLLAQDFPDFELVILDNQSTDKTADICLTFANKDRRIRYNVDSQLRNGHDGATHIASFARGQYYMCASDDDLWDRRCLSRLVSLLDSDPSLGLVYSNGFFIDESGNKIRQMLRSNWRMLRSGNSRVYNFCHFSVLRNVVPVALGMYRTEVYRRALPFITFDATVADVDNLFIMKVLTMTDVGCVDEPLLYYRVYPVHERWEDPKYGKYPSNLSGIAKRYYYLRHEIRFIYQIFRTIDQSAFGVMAKQALKIVTLGANCSRMFMLPIYFRLRSGLKLG